jgi:hypothetical protein
MKFINLEKLYIHNTFLRIFLSFVLFLLTFLLLIPKPVPPKKRKSEVYEDLSEDVPLVDLPPSFKYDL